MAGPNVAEPAGSGNKATARSAIINLMNTIMGAGMLAMPYGVKSNGLVLGVFVIIFSACTSGFGLYLQGKCTRYVTPGNASFFELSKLTYPQLGVIFDLAIAVKCFGVGISYLVVIGDLMPKIVNSLVNDQSVLENYGYLLNRNFWITIFMVSFIAPLSFLRKLDSLKYASMIALSSVAYLVVLVFIHFAEHDIIEKGPISVIKPYSLASMLSSFPIFVFAYTCHQNMFSLVNELQDKSSDSINKIIKRGIGSAMCLYILVGVTGYLTFGDLVTGNVIAMYPDSTSTTIGRIAIVVLVMLSFPLQCHPCRASVNHVLFYFQTSEVAESIRKLSRSLSTSSTSANTSVVSSSSLNVPIISSSERRNLLRESLEYGSTNAASSAANTSTDDESVFTLDEASMIINHENQILKVTLGTTKFIILTSIIVIASYLIAINVTSLEHILAFVGSTGSTSISFILPGIFGYKLIEASDLKSKIVKNMALVLSIWGFIVMIICLSATIFLGATH